MTTWERGAIRDAELRRSLVTPRGPLRKLEAVAELDSTNTALLEAAITEPMLWPDRTVLLADHQTAGRGRAEREWLTPAGSSITLSLLVRPAVPAAQLPLVTLALGLATCRALERSSGVEARLKWPNDVVITALADAAPVPGWGMLRKVGGILAESLGDGRVVIGIGLNISQTLDELPVPHATSLRAAGAKRAEREVLIEAILLEFFALLSEWEASTTAASTEILEPAAALTTTLGAEIEVTRPGGVSLTGTAVGFAANGGLIMQLADESFEHITAGDVQHVRIAKA